MDKEKIIEEMARVLCQNQCPSCTGATCLALLNCKALYEHGYRKITENEVVISKEKYERLTKDRSDFDKFARSICNIRMSKGKPIATFEDLQEYIELQLEQTRKETAREILSELMKNIEFTFGLDGRALNKLNADFVLNMCKKYGVEIGEDK